MEKNITYEITESAGIIRREPTGWTKELNRVRWNGGTVKWDIRQWDETHTHMSKGITLTDEEMKEVVGLYLEREGKNADQDMC